MVTGGTGIDDGEATMAETNSLTGVGRVGSPEAIVVTASMLEGLEHGRDKLLGSTLTIPAMPHMLTQFDSGSNFGLGFNRQGAQDAKDAKWKRYESKPLLRFLC